MTAMPAAPVLHATEGDVRRARMRELAGGRFERSCDASTRFFETHVDTIAAACLGLATRFRNGGRLLVFGSGASATDAHHVAVEFVHPVLVGKRALPAVALTSDVATLTGAMPGGGFAAALSTLGRANDIAMSISTGAADSAARRGMQRARTMEMLTLALTGGTANARETVDADFHLNVPDDDPMIVQEVHETLYHVLWELVHVFLDHRVSAEGGRHA